VGGMGRLGGMGGVWLVRGECGWYGGSVGDMGGSE
jgi:hypothetical protein